VNDVYPRVTASDRLTGRSLALSKVLCLFAAALPLLAAIGWIFGIPLLTQVHLALPAMQPNTAAGLIVSIIATLLVADRRGSPKTSQVALVLSAIVSLFGLLTLSQYVFGWNLQLDRLFLEANIPGRLHPGRPAPQTAANFALLGVALAIYNSRFLPIRIGQVCALIVGANAVVAITGYIFSTSQFYGFPLFQTDMAVHTAGCFIFIIAALLCSRPRDGMMSLVTSDTRSGGMARKILLTAILAPPVVGVLTRIGVIANWYAANVQISLFVVIIVALLLRTTWQAARRSEYDELGAKAILSELKRSQQQIRQSEERFELALRGADLGTWDWNIQTGEVIFNSRWAEMRGFRLEEIKPHVDSWRAGVHPDDWPHVQKAVTDHFQGLLPEYETEFRALTKSGNWIWVLDRGKVFSRDEKGQCLRMVGTELDITERRRLEEELRISEAKASGILSISADAIISIDESQHITLFNEGAEKIFGYERAAVIGASLDMLIPERYRIIHREHVNGFIQGRESSRRMGQRGAVISGLRKNGEQFPADAAISKLDVAGKRIMTVALRDITEQKRVEYEQTFLAEVGAVLASTLDYEDTLKNIAGLAVRDLADLCVIDVAEEDGKIRRLRVANRDPAKALFTDLSKELRPGRDQFPWIRPILEDRRPILIDHLLPDMVASLQSDEQDLSAPTDLKSMLAVPLLARGRLVGVIALASRISSRYGPADARLVDELAQRAAFSIENARLLRETQRAVTTREDVLAIVSHDLKNPVATIGLIAHVLRRFEQIEAGKLREFGWTLQRSVEKMDRLISDLLDFAKIQSGTFSVATSADQLNRVLTSVIDGIRAQAEAKRQTLLVELPPHLPEVALDDHRIGQVMSNLLGNAIKFTPEGGTIRVSARLNGNVVEVSVEDTGPGIPAEQLAKVFDRFWQAPETLRMGSGLGLSIAKGIVEAHCGTIWAESQLGKGSSFHFTLPVADPWTIRTPKAS